MAGTRILPDDRAACCPSVLDAPLGETDAVDLARVFGALADPVRLRALSLIARAGEVCSCDMLDALDRSQPTISHHTKTLAEAGLITGEKRGRWVWWSIVPERLEAVRAALQGEPASGTVPRTAPPGTIRQPPSPTPCDQ